MRFPNLYGNWTHWKITRDGHCIGIVDGADFLKAMLEEEEKAAYEISNYSNDERTRERHQWKDA